MLPIPAAGERFCLDDKGYVAMAKRLGKPLMIGELGLRAAKKTESKVWREAPGYFESFDDTAAAKPWVMKTLQGAVDSGVTLLEMRN